MQIDTFDHVKALKASAGIPGLNRNPDSSSALTAVSKKKKKNKGSKSVEKAEPPRQQQVPAAASQSQQETTDPTKRLRNLKKKLRDIEALEAKLDSGEVKNPEPEQLEKVVRKAQVQAEIRALEERVVA